MFNSQILLSPRQHAVGTTLGPMAYCTDGHMKLLLNTVANTSVLFDLEADPDETNDIALDNPVSAAKLRGIIEAKMGAWSPPSGDEPNMRAMLKLLGYKD
jgi:hypothetical protein